MICSYLTGILQDFLIHDKIGDKFNSENYLAISLSSLVLKVLDWAIFKLPI